MQPGPERERDRGGGGEVQEVGVERMVSGIPDSKVEGLEEMVKKKIATYCVMRIE